MEKKTDKSPVEQMREWLGNKLITYYRSEGVATTVLQDIQKKFNELFPEVQQLPIEDIEGITWQKTGQDNTPTPLISSEQFTVINWEQISKDWDKSWDNVELE